MAVIVQKYGGTSVGSVERIQAVAQRIHETARAGHSMVVVVSAMGKTTNQLIDLAHQVTSSPSRREMDMLLSTGEQVSIALMSMALHELGTEAVSLTGAQVGIVTEAEHTRARILQIDTQRLQQHLDKGKVVVVAGFQGVSDRDNLEITTLGRGGSDTTAVALAAALPADTCEIYTDVAGILTADPRHVEDAQLMSEITCDEMLELASLGAKVLHPRAVEIARNYGVPLVVRSSWTDEPGTKVISPAPVPKVLQGLELVHPVDAVEFDSNQAKVALLRVGDRPGIAARMFGEIGRQEIDVDLIIQSIHEGNTNDIAFTVGQDILKRAESVAHAIAPVLRTEPHNTQEAEVMVDPQVAKVGIAGAGIIGRPGVAAQMFTALSSVGINIQMISTSEVKVSCVIDAEQCDRAIEVLCETFELSSSPVALSNVPMQEQPAVRGAALDMKQASLGIVGVPDRPGMAAKIFQALAERGICVDTIIQSQRCRVVDSLPRRDIAFTLPEADLEEAQAVLADLESTVAYGEIAVNRAIAKVSIVGSGMVGHPGVAAKMFSILAESGINIQMISTSEIKISCVVDAEQGVKALQAIHAAFHLSQPQEVAVSQ
jgi:aspartate kinase